MYTLLRLREQSQFHHEIFYFMKHLPRRQCTTSVPVNNTVVDSTGGKFISRVRDFGFSLRCQ
jgi:hypothetical protein